MNLIQPNFMLAAGSSEVIDFDFSKVHTGAAFLIEVSYSQTAATTGLTIDVYDAYGPAFAGDADCPSLPKAKGGASGLRRETTDPDTYTLSVTPSQGSAQAESISINFVRANFSAPLVSMTITNNDATNAASVRIVGRVV